jgi:dihydropteroate synthase
MRAEFQLHYNGKTLALGARTCIMGIVNLTPDSFYDGGRLSSVDEAVQFSLQLANDGADILDLGGQSTRPGAEPIGTENEMARVLPVLKAVRKQTDAWISIDTYRSEVARICLEEGADMINDVSSFREDPQMPSVVANAGAPVVLMHFLKSIHPMPPNPQYNHLLEDILNFFRETLQTAASHGISSDKIIVDPGIGFGKSMEHSLAIMKQLYFLTALGRPILVGPSRKSFISKLTGLAADDRLEGSAAAVGMCLMQGAHIIRIHDVAFFRRFCAVMDALL